MRPGPASTNVHLRPSAAARSPPRVDPVRVRRLLGTVRRRCSAIGAEDGFTLIEVAFAALIAGVGLLGTVVTFDASRDLVTLSERKEAAVHRGEREIERILSMDYEQVGLSSAPISSGDPVDPAYHVTTGTSPTYRWNQRAGAPPPHTEYLAIDPAGEVSSAVEPWTDGRLRGRIQRFVTWVNDARCPETLCEGTGDYKRVTVAVSFDQPDGPVKPILLSTLIADPDAKPVGPVVDGVENPLTSPTTSCLDARGVRVDCALGVGGLTRTWFLYDTPAAPAGAREPILDHHATHPTVACGSSGSSGCPVPDLMGEEPPPATDPAQPLFRYSNELSPSGYVAGRVLQRDVDCQDEPSTTDNTKGQMWVTPPLTAATSLTGRGGLSLHAHTLAEARAKTTFCLAFYDVPRSLDNLGDNRPVEIGRSSYRVDSLATEAGIVTFTFAFRGDRGDATLAVDRRIGLRVWIAASSTADAAAVYDHPTHPSSLQLNARTG